MGQNHLSRLASPKNWKLARKENKYITRPLAGPHPLSRCLTVNFLLKNLLNYAKTAKEVKNIINSGGLLIDGVVRKDYKFPIGIMDIIELPKLKESYKIVFNKKGNFVLIPLDKDEQNTKLLKVIKKSIVKNGKLQITFHDGRNILLDKSDAKIGDSVLYDLKNKKINKLFSLDKGSFVYLVDGSYVGVIAKVKELVPSKDMKAAKLVLEIGDKDYITLRNYVFVVGNGKVEVGLEAKS
ncbi:30S ribosomal protein S4e [Candidatus Woesearchaeota archaeon]|nr:30S ribosomal protein S4e [Candidatus Woesearchaeota archaeon]